ncbi:MAG: Ig-like domain-containing protein [Lachnospiraceae bacterium]|nr:Ig-like domain-containing protein [Lachnospiraceae bacterium]
MATLVLPGMNALAEENVVTLTEDVILEEMQVISENTTYDLSGHTLSMREGVENRIFLVKEGATLTINDSVGGGKITGGYAVSGSQVAPRDPSSSFGNMELRNAGSNLGGAVYVEKGATLIMNGGSISGNRAVVGGGVFVEKGGSFHVSGELYIQDNYKGADGEVVQNVCLPYYGQSGSAITVDGTLNPNTTIGFIGSVYKKTSSLYTLTSGLNGKGERENFVSDDAYYYLYKNESNEAVYTPIKQEHSHIYSYAASGGTITATCSGDSYCWLPHKKITLTPSAKNGIFGMAENFPVTYDKKTWSDAGCITPEITYYKTANPGATTGGTSLGSNPPNEIGNYYGKFAITYEDVKYISQGQNGWQNAYNDCSFSLLSPEYGWEDGVMYFYDWYDEDNEEYWYRNQANEAGLVLDDWNRTLTKVIGSKTYIYHCDDYDPVGKDVIEVREQKTVSVAKAYSVNAPDLVISGATLTDRQYIKDNVNVEVSEVTFKDKESGTVVPLNYGTDYTATAVMEDDAAGEDKTATVTVTMLADCGLEETEYEGATVTISKGAYAGEKASSVSLIGVTGKTAEVTLPELPEGASYSAAVNNNTGFFSVGEITEGKVTVTAAKNFDRTTETGSLTFTVPVTGALNYLDYNITVTVTPGFKPYQTIESNAENDALSLTYGETGRSITAEAEGDISYSSKNTDVVDIDESGVLTPKKAGTATITITAAETEDYAETTKDITVTVGKANPVLASPETVSGLRYTGSSQALLTEGQVVEGSTAYYALGDADTAPAFDGTSEAEDKVWSTDIPRGTNTDKYHVWYLVKGNDKYKDTQPEHFEVSIGKALPPVLVNEQKPTAIDPVLYNGKEQALVSAPENVPNGYTVHYSIDAGENWSGDIPKRKNVGDYTVKVKYVGDNNHESFDGEDILVSIAKVNPEYTLPTGLSASYGQKLSEIPLPEGWTWNNANETVGNAGTNAIKATFTPEDTDNYNILNNIDVSVTVAKVDSSVKKAPESITGLVYSGAKQNLVTAGEGSGGTMQYAVTQTDAAPQDANLYKEEIPGATDAGTYYVWYKVVGDGNHNDFVEPDYIRVSIAKDTEGIVEFKQDEGSVPIETMVEGVQSANINEFAKTQVDPGKEVKVLLEVTPKTEENMNPDSVTNMTVATGEVFGGINSENIITEYLEIDIAKYVNNVLSGNITNTEAPIEIEFTVDPTKAGNPVAVRNHDGSVRVFDKLIERPAAQEDYRDGTYFVDGDKIYLYSQYFSDFAIIYATEPTYNVGFETKVGDRITRVVAAGKTVVLPEGIVNEGYAFSGWFRDEEYQNLWNIATDTVNEDIVLYAKWNKSVGGISVASNQITLTKAGETSQIIATITPQDAANLNVFYSSDNTKVATVDANGKVTAIGNGSATITVVTEDGAKTATIRVTVNIPETAKEKEERIQNALNAGLKISQKGSKINIKWGQVKEADGYEVYVGYCGKAFGKAVKVISTNKKTNVDINKLKGKKLDLTKNFKVYITAYKKDKGKKVRLAKTITGHVVGRLNSVYTNAKSITLSKSKYTVKVGKSITIKAKTNLVDKNKKQLTDAHAKEFRFASSNKKIAKVNSKGKVTGVSAGTCTIYVYARNGYAKTVKVTVK